MVYRARVNGGVSDNSATPGGCNSSAQWWNRSQRLLDFPDQTRLLTDALRLTTQGFRRLRNPVTEALCDIVSIDRAQLPDAATNDRNVAGDGADSRRRLAGALVVNDSKLNGNRSLFIACY